MPNPTDIRKYPVLLFEAFGQAAAQPTVVIHCKTVQTAKNLRSLAYTFRKLLLASPEAWHKDLGVAVQDKKFYIDGLDLVISPPMYIAQTSATLEPAQP